MAPRAWGSGCLEIVTDGQGVEWVGCSELQGQQRMVASGPGGCSLDILPRRSPVCRDLESSGAPGGVPGEEHLGVSGVRGTSSQATQ